MSLTVVMSTAMIGCTRHPVSAPANGTASASATDTAAADKALCTAVAPILAESDRVANAWIGSGPDGSPQRDAAQPAFTSDTKAWTARAQDALDSHPEAQAFLRRSLQRFIDDNRILAEALRPGPLKPYNNQTYLDSNASYTVPVSICGELGIKW